MIFYAAGSCGKTPAWMCITDFLWRYSKAMAAQGLPVIFCADHLANKLMR